jgi:hypothetical protein
MQLSSGTSKGVGKSIGLIGTGEGCAILVRIEGKTICPRREPLKGWILSPVRRRIRRTTGLNQTYGNDRAHSIFWFRECGKMVLEFWGASLSPTLRTIRVTETNQTWKN